MRFLKILILCLASSGLLATSDNNQMIAWSLKNIEYELDQSFSAYPGNLQFEQIKKTIRSSACLKTFSQELLKPENKVAFDKLEPKFVQFDALLKKYSEDNKFKRQLSEFNKEIDTLPKNKLCPSEFKN